MAGYAGLVIEGRSRFDRFAHAAVGLGDVDGDGVDDLALAAPREFLYADAEGDPSGAGVYVLFGRDRDDGPLPARLDAAALDGRDGLRLQIDWLETAGGLYAELNEPGHFLAAGDLDGDGLGDLAIATRSTLAGGFHGDEPVSAVFVLFGRDAAVAPFGPSPDLGRLLEDGGAIEIAGVEGSLTGLSVSPDLDGDGLDDLVISTAPRPADATSGFGGPVDPDDHRALATVVRGRRDLADAGLDVRAPGPDRGFVLSVPRGSSAHGADDDPGLDAGGALAGGDLDGDGLGDLIGVAVERRFLATTPGAPYGEETVSRDAFALFGEPDGPATDADGRAPLATSDAEALDWPAIEPGGEPPVIAALGDVNADGFGDLGVLRPDREGSGTGGVVHVLFGGPDGPVRGYEGAPAAGEGMALHTTGDDATVGLAAAGDLDGDGVDDIAVALAGGDALVVLGRAGAALPDRLDLADPADGWGWRFAAGSGVGTPTLASVGDVDADGIDDLLVGGAAEAWVLFGGRALGVADAADGASDRVITPAGLAAPLPDAPRPAISPLDRDGDGAADLLWQLPDGGVRGWLGDGDEADIGATGPDWRVVDLADLTGDGRAEVLFRNDRTGATWHWRLDGDAVAGQGGWGRVGAEWHVLATPDLDGDGTGDLLWRHDDGGLFVWRMADAAIAEARGLGGLDRAWRLEGTADLDADGDHDLVWRHDNGTAYAWLMAGAAIEGQGVLAEAGPAWDLAAIADLDGDGAADLVWQRDDGATYAQRLDGTATVAQGGFGALAGWRLAGTGDLDADGSADLVWRHESSGALYGWLMDGLAIAEQGGLGPSDGAALLDVVDTDGDGRDDLLFRDAASGTLSARLLDGLAVAGERVLAMPGEEALALVEGVGLWDEG